MCRLVLDFVGGGGRLNNTNLFFLIGSEIGVDRSTILSATNFLNCVSLSLQHSMMMLQVDQ